MSNEAAQLLGFILIATSPLWFFVGYGLAWWLDRRNGPGGEK